MAYLLLCRHAAHRDGHLTVDEASGRYPTDSVVRVLREELHVSTMELRLLLYAPTPESRRTARLLVNGLDAAPAAGSAASRSTCRLRRAQVRQRKSEVQELQGSGLFQLARYPVTTRPLEVDYDECPELHPDTQRANSNAQQAMRVIEERLRKLAHPKERAALLVVGHQPGLSWLSHHFTSVRGLAQLWRWDAGAVPIDRTEVVCIEVNQTKQGKWRGHTAWTVHPGDGAALAQIQDKVKSKMESAKLLSGVITLAVTALLGVLLDRAKWQALRSCATTPSQQQEQACLDVTPFGVSQLAFSGQAALQVAFGLLLLALALFLMTMYAYDTLLMPRRFWGEAPTSTTSRRWLVRVSSRRPWLPSRPPSSSAWVVYRNMMRIWFRLFTPAVVLVIAAFILLAVALLRLPFGGYLALTTALIVLAFYRWWFRPVLGSED